MYDNIHFILRKFVGHVSHCLFLRQVPRNLSFYIIAVGRIAFENDLPRKWFTHRFYKGNLTRFDNKLEIWAFIYETIHIKQHGRSVNIQGLVLSCISTYFLIAFECCLLFDNWWCRTLILIKLRNFTFTNE